MKMYEHGGNVYDYNIEMIDFSSNINPLGVPPCVKKVIEDVVLTKYPDIKYRELKTSISEYIAYPLKNIIVGNGAAELIHLFVRAKHIKKPLIPSPAFAEYERAVKLEGGAPIYYRIKEEEGFKLNVSEMAEMINEADSVILGNPNNPTGQPINHEEIRYLLNKALELNIPVMVDEAFIEFIYDYEKYEVISYVKEFDNLFVVRAATKFFGMPGLRLGYGVGSSRMILKMEDYKEPWTVNAFADMIGREIFKDKEYINETRRYINNEINFMLNELKKIDYLKVYETNVNFILLKLKKGNVDVLKERLIKEGILIRDASNFKYLDKRYFRVAVKKHEENMKLITALEDMKWD
ncbi:threonine-phosphate decarboxylase [Aceticella autotrophica]|uniref:threonine-phosphate decarboxylase n=1 Tax=Aceticella autotrophica TaxID=2755338 RepID=A0A975AXK1_9THEO|nr:threonine-phosphate decarboxylase CobD [Aceticella autotrophica]QSZ28340.1 threonine-phosphate decarboxylase [Aceticella autotrophica]